jgi:hypothetical protein
MARINIEDSLYTDFRFLELHKKLDNLEMAIGAMVRAWTVAQKWYTSQWKMIPVSVWEKQKLNNFIIECGLATREGDFIKMAGADEQFSWLVQRSEAGKRSARSKAEKKSTVVESRSTVVNGSQPLSLSLSPSLKKEDTYLLTKSLPDEIGMAWDVWNETLDAFKITRTNIMPQQENSLARGIKQLGLDNVILALEGARFERPGKDFRPQDHLSIDRVLHRDRFGKSNVERFKNLALANKSNVNRLTEEELNDQATGRVRA